MADLVRGEASESDEDAAEIGHIQKNRILASEVSGEATESDEDVYEQDTKVAANKTAESYYKNDLLQRKLIENNIAIWKNLSIFVRQMVVPASKQLLSTDHMLMKSQVSMQSVLSSLKMAQTNMQKIHEKSKDIFTTNFIPNITK